MAIEKLTEFAKTGQKNTDDLNLEIGFVVNRKPARQWFNWLFNTLTTKINEIIDGKLDSDATAVAAQKLQTSRQISFSGAATGSFNFDGSKGESCVLTLANSGAGAGTYGTTLKVPVITVNAKGLITTVTTQDIPTASTSAKGLVELATNAETLAGTDATRAVTPAALMSLFANNKAETGYTKLPNGLIIQWGEVLESTSATDYKTFPIAFPNSAFVVLPQLNRSTPGGHSGNYGLVAEIIDKTKFIFSVGGTLGGGAYAYYVAIGY